MRFYLRLACKVAGCLALLLFLSLWAISYTVFDRVSMPLHGKRMLVLISYQGSFSAVVIPLDIPEVWWERGDVDVPGNTYPDQMWPRKRIIGFGWITQTLYLNVPNSPDPRDRQTSGLTGRSWGASATGLLVPDWLISLLLIGAAVLPWRKARFSTRSLLMVTTVVAMLLGILTMANRASLEKLTFQ